MGIVYIGLGSNLGDRVGNIQKALNMMRENNELSAVSSLYETEPEGYENQEWFLNAAAGLKSDLPPQELLNLLKGIERSIGRSKSERWGPREIDLDVLLYDQLCFESPDITIPHPRMHQRKFVLAPLAEIAPDVIHPVLCKTIGMLLAELQTSKIVRQAVKFIINY